jgi:hypothetical protein
MEELERRLRSALTELAEEVPPSHNAWIEHERRLALKSRRARVRPGLMAAVAAAVVALIAVPVTVLNLKSNGVEQAAIPTPDSSSTASTAPSAAVITSHRYTEIPGERLLTEPYPIGGLDKGNGLYWDNLVYTVFREDLKMAQLCTVTLPANVAINDQEQRKKYPSLCVQLKPSSKKLVWYQGFGPNSTGAYLYVADPKVNAILVRRGENDAYREAYRIGEGPDFAVLLANLGSSVPPKSYTARNQQGQDLENG